MDFYEVIKERRSVRRYKPDQIPDDILNRILETGRIAPSAKNIQPWHFIICGCALEDIAWGRMGGYMSSFAVDLAIAMEHMILAAANEGLGTCWIGAFVEKDVKKILGIPDNVRVVALTPVGYPAEVPKDRGRKLLKDIVSYDKY
jgi:nitroreductase